MPVDITIQRWLGSEARASLMAKLRGLAGQIRRQEPVDITSATYSVLRELVLTELSAYSVVRIGAWVRMPYRSFVRSKPAWQQGNSVDTRPVTTPPDNACNHQKVGKTSSAMSDLTRWETVAAMRLFPPRASLL